MLVYFVGSYLQGLGNCNLVIDLWAQKYYQIYLMSEKRRKEKIKKKMEKKIPKKLKRKNKKN
jgi:hypothetical protein